MADLILRAALKQETDTQVVAPSVSFLQSVNPSAITDTKRKRSSNKVISVDATFVKSLLIWSRLHALCNNLLALVQSHFLQK